MRLNINRAVQIFIFFCFFAMLIPEFIDLGERSAFIGDFYAKRIMTLFSIPFFAIIIYLTIKKKTIKVSKNVALYIGVFVLYLVNSFILMNKLSLIALDLFVNFLPVLFYFLIFKIDFNTNNYYKSFPAFLFIACVLVILGIKLQFSYFSMLGIVYIIFLSRGKIFDYVFMLFLPILAINTLIGKSALIMLIFMMVYFFIFDKNLVGRQKKIYLALIPSVLIGLGIIIFWGTIKETGAYKNTYYFFRHADFINFKFTDMSTGQRLLEAKQVLIEFSRSNYYINVFGNGFGATIDLSETKDVSIIRAQNNLKNVRHIHVGFFAVLHRFGLLGIIIYFSFIRKMIKCSKIIFKYSNNYILVLSTLYVLIIIFDSFISFPHMMSNFLFWFITFIVIKESQIIKKQVDILSNEVL